MTIRDISQQGMELNTLDTSSSNTDDDSTMNGHSKVSSLMWSLDDMSCQMLKLSKKLNELQTENDNLQDEMKRQRLEKQRSMMFHPAAMGC